VTSAFVARGVSRAATQGQGLNEYHAVHARKDVNGDDVVDDGGAGELDAGRSRPRVAEDELSVDTLDGCVRVRCERCADDGGVRVVRARE